MQHHLQPWVMEAEQEHTTVLGILRRLRGVGFLVRDAVASDVTLLAPLLQESHFLRIHKMPGSVDDLVVIGEI
jgi:hypothetical protein